MQSQYIVIHLDFQFVSADDFADSASFVTALSQELLQNSAVISRMPEKYKEQLQKLADGKRVRMAMLLRLMGQWAQESDQPLVLMIDEVDNSSGNQVFLDFLGILRADYSNEPSARAFYSVILAGVHDIRNLQLKIRPDTEHKHNSPWNIANSLDIDMSFSPEDIAGMLNEYETDYHTGMDIAAISQLIYDYTSGYPVLVSMICRNNDEKLEQNAWTAEGVAAAAKMIVNESAPLFESLINKIEQYQDLRNMLFAMLFNGAEYSFTPDNAVIGLANMYGFISNNCGKVQIANRIFETRLYNYFLSIEKMSNPLAQDSSLHRNEFIETGTLNMEKILERFTVVYTDLYGDQPDAFLEDAGRRLFLLFLRPIINGTANYYIEAQTRNQRRTDLIIDYLGTQFIVEMKIWHGKEYNERGEKQLAEYLDYYHINKGYMLSFNFNQNKQIGTHSIQIGDKTLFEAIV